MATLLTQTYNLNLIPGQNIVVVNAAAYDNSPRLIRFTMFNGAVAADISGWSARVEGTRQGTKAGFSTVCTVASPVVSFAITDAMTASSGKHQAAVVFYQGEKRVASATFILNVAPAVLDESTPATEEDTTIYQQWIAANTSQIQTNANDIAVLKGRMDEFASLPPGSTEGNAELVDIRVGAGGETYPTAGDAVRNQITNLKTAIGYAPDVDIKPEMLLKSVANNVGVGEVVDVTTLSATTARHKIISCHSGDQFVVKGNRTNTTAIVWALTDKNYRLVEKNTANSVDETITAKVDGYAIFNFSANSYIGDSVLIIRRVLPYSNYEQLNILSELYTQDVTEKVIRGYYINTGIGAGNVVNVEQPVISANRGYYIAAVKNGEKITITGAGGTAPRLWAFVDEEYILQRVANADATEAELTLTAIQNGFFIINVDIRETYSIVVHKYIALSGRSYESGITVERVNPFDYGVVGDGVNDDTDAINAALEAAAGKEIYFPSGTYMFSGTIYIQSNTHLIGVGQSTIFQLADTFTLSSIRHREDQDSYKYPMMRLADGAVSCTLEHFKIKGQTAAFKDEPEVGLLIIGNDHIVNDVTVEDANFFPDDFAGRTSNAPAWGFMIFNAEHIRITNCKGINCGYEALGTEAATDCLIDNFEAGFCNQTCLQVHRNSYDIAFISCTVRYELPEGATVRPAFTMHGGSDEYDLDGIEISECNFYGGITFIGGYENGISIINNIVTGGVTMNAAINRKNIFIIGNRFDGGISGRFQNAVIIGNMATNNTGGRFITVNGDNIICAHNIPLGTGRYVAVNDVTVEQWGTNPALT